MGAARLTLALAIAAAFAACGGSGTAPSTTTTTPAPLRADISDPVGDAAADARVPVPPDLVHATMTVASQSLMLVVTFAPGTFARQTTKVSALLDTDSNGTTGIRQPDGVGADYSIDIDANTGSAAILKANPASCAARITCFDGAGSASATVLADGVQVTVPLSAIGGGDGHMIFQLNAYANVAPLTPVIFDFLPDTNIAPARVQ